MELIKMKTHDNYNYALQVANHLLTNTNKKFHEGVYLNMKDFISSNPEKTIDSIANHNLVLIAMLFIQYLKPTQLQLNRCSKYLYYIFTLENIDLPTAIRDGNYDLFITLFSEQYLEAKDHLELAKECIKTSRLEFFEIILNSNKLTLEMGKELLGLVKEKPIKDKISFSFSTEKLIKLIQLKFPSLIERKIENSDISMFRKLYFAGTIRTDELMEIYLTAIIESNNEIFREIYDDIKLKFIQGTALKFALLYNNEEAIKILKYYIKVRESDINIILETKLNAMEKHFIDKYYTNKTISQIEDNDNKDLIKDKPLSSKKIDDEFLRAFKEYDTKKLTQLYTNGFISDEVVLKVLLKSIECYRLNVFNILCDDEYVIENKKIVYEHAKKFCNTRIMRYYENLSLGKMETNQKLDLSLNQY